MLEFSKLFSRQRIVPVVTIRSVESAVPLANALLAGGVAVIEVTLRTDAALAAISAIRKAVPDMCVGAGTLVRTEQFAPTRDAGAEFFVSPGVSPTLIDAADRVGVPWLPGVMTPSDIITILPTGRKYLKLFPAVQAGGTAMLSTLASVFPQLMFCPTGGISEATAPDFLKLANVAAIGGSWMVPAAPIDSGHWATITELTIKAAAIGSAAARDKVATT